MNTYLTNEYVLRDHILRNGDIYKARHGSTVNAMARLRYLARDIKSEIDKYENKPIMRSFYRELMKEHRLTGYAISYLASGFIARGLE